MRATSFSFLKTFCGLLLVCFGLPLLAVAQPVITLQPVSHEVSIGASVTFSVGANSPNPLRYQWHLNGEILRGEHRQTGSPGSVRWAAPSTPCSRFTSAIV